EAAPTYQRDSELAEIRVFFN
ncbi:hypothetical protein CCACVL1_01465, partial [Corchorus capsularis]